MFKTTFKFGQKQQEQEVPEIKLEEQMLFKDIPEDKKNVFKEVYKFIVENRESSKKDQEKVQIDKVVTMQKDLSAIRDDAISDIFGILSSLARQIDSGSKTLNEFKKDLSISKSDFDIANSGSNKKHPTPFLLKYVDDIENTAEELSQSIIAYTSHLQPKANSVTSSEKQNNNENQVLYNFLKEQSNAIFRCSTKVSKLTTKMTQARQALSDKLKINSLDFSFENKNITESNVQSINTKYQQFLEQKKQKEKRGIDESDIFGGSKVSVKSAAPASKFSFSSGNKNFQGFGTKKNDTATDTKKPS